MVRDLLEASRAESGKISIGRRCVSISDLIRTAAAMMQASANEKGVGLEVKGDAVLLLSTAILTASSKC